MRSSRIVSLVSAAALAVLLLAPAVGCGLGEQAPPLEFGPEDRPIKRDDIQVRGEGDQFLLIAPNLDNPMVLRPQARRIFELMDGDRSVQQIADELAAEFDMAPDEALGRLKEFLEQMAEQGLVEVADDR